MIEFLLKLVGGALTTGPGPPAVRGAPADARPLWGPLCVLLALWLCATPTPSLANPNVIHSERNDKQRRSRSNRKLINIKSGTITVSVLLVCQHLLSVIVGTQIPAILIGIHMAVSKDTMLRFTHVLPLHLRKGTTHSIRSTTCSKMRHWRRRRKIHARLKDILLLKDTGGIQNLTFTRLERDRLARIGKKDYRETIIRADHSMTRIASTKDRQRHRSWPVLPHQPRSVRRHLLNLLLLLRRPIASWHRRPQTANPNRPTAMHTALSRVRWHRLPRRDSYRHLRCPRRRLRRIDLLQANRGTIRTNTTTIRHINHHQIDTISINKTDTRFLLVPVPHPLVGTINR
ncbi:uncharacterized protein LOC143205007 [Rhynchophorus ferrugineus]|uniref:uncharacterized protein LOC143205007 n=1 Tax=Rhynchophorus ferrugineus TaxID=354439 RepID=UPI003FCE47E9